MQTRLCPSDPIVDYKMGESIGVSLRKILVRLEFSTYSCSTLSGHVISRPKLAIKCTDQTCAYH